MNMRDFKLKMCGFAGNSPRYLIGMRYRIAPNFRGQIIS